MIKQEQKRLDNLEQLVKEAEQGRSKAEANALTLRGKYEKLLRDPAGVTVADLDKARAAAEEMEKQEQTKAATIATLKAEAELSHKKVSGLQQEQFRQEAGERSKEILGRIETAAGLLLAGIAELEKQTAEEILKPAATLSSDLYRILKQEDKKTPRAVEALRVALAQSRLHFEGALREAKR